MDYQWNEEAKPIADRLIAEHHPHLAKIKIAYLFKIKSTAVVKPQKKRAGRMEMWGKAAKVTDKYRPLLEEAYRFVIEFDSVVWYRLNDKQRRALVDHELCHCGIDAEGPYMKHHDLEEFRGVVERHGFWRDSVQDFANVVLPLFDRRAPVEEGTVTISAEGMKPITMTNSEFKRAAHRIGRQRRSAASGV